MFLTFDSVDRTPKCNLSLESCWAVLYCGTGCFPQFVILENVSILDFALSVVKGLNSVNIRIQLKLQCFCVW